jgi:predicted transcriptional regulator
MSETPDSSAPNAETVRMAVDIAAAYVSRNTLPSDQVAAVIRSAYAALAETHAKPVEAPVPAVSIRRSVTPDYLVCLEDGKKLKMLKRYLRTHYAMTPDDYRAKWGLAADYPMVAPNYSKKRSAFAKQFGLGRKGTAGTAKRKRAKTAKK